MAYKTLCVILSGGSGTRLWPVSRKSYPKQFLDIMDCGLSMLQTTVNRALKINDGNLPVIIASYEHRFIVSEQLRQIGCEKCKIILEKQSKNTLPAALIAAFEANNNDFDTVAFLPSDHVIKNETKFIEYFKEAVEIAHKTQKIVTFGVNPTTANINYGYIQKNPNNNEILSFKEKPNLETATKYLQSGNFLWNSGMFVFDVKTVLNEIKELNPKTYNHADLSYKNAALEYQYFVLNDEYFNNIEGVSIDYGLMEKTTKGAIIKCDNIEWNDVGEFAAIYELNKKDQNNNVADDKNIILNNTKNSYIINKSNSKIVVSDIDKMLIVATQDITMITNLDQTTNIKSLVDNLVNLKLPEISQNCFEHRPWGKYENLFETNQFKVKKITVLPQKQLSLQMHHKRSEHWIVISGFAEVQLDDKIINLTADKSVYIPVQCKHRVKNTSLTEDLIFVEVQSGSYFGEDDIIRFEDNFGRV